MASSIVLRRATAPSLFSKLTNPIRSASVSLSFNSNSTQVTKVDEKAHSLDVDRRDSAPTFFSDVFDPFLPPRSLTQVLNLMDQLMVNAFLSSTRGDGAQRGWDVTEDENALYLRVDMPGVDKDHVKVSVEQNTLIIRGEGEKENDDEESVRE